MRGLQPRPKKSNAVDDPTAQPKLGLIKGKGTGTSDDIKTQVPTGGFIMPADSTKKMGAENLDELGYNDTVPASVSNGEYQMPPEQVHAIGLQALDQMRNQTHEFSGNNGASMNPIDYAQQGEGNGDNKPALFFADGTPARRDTLEWDTADKAKAAALGIGGAVYGAGKALGPAASALNTTTGGLAKEIGQGLWSGAKAAKAANIPGISGNVAKSGLGRLAVAGALGATAFDGFDTPTEQYRERFGLGQANPNDSNGMQLAKDLGVRTLGLASDLGSNATLGLAAKFYRDKQNIAANAPAVAPVVATTPATEAKVSAPAQAMQPTTNNPFVPPPVAPAAATSQQAAQPQLPAAGLPNNITRNGNSFSGNNIGAGYTINGQPSGVSATNPQANSAQNQQAVQNLLANTPEMGMGLNPTNSQAALNNARQQAGAINAAQGMQAQRYDDRQRIENDLRMARSAMPVGNAQGQTKSQQDMVTNLQNQLNAVSAQGYDEYKNQTNNNAALDKQLMGDDAANARVAMQEAGATARNTLNNQTDFGKFGLTNNLENRKFNSDEQAKAPANQQAQRVESLRQQYDAAKTPEDRKSILERINEISGTAKSNSDRFKAVNGPETVDPTTRTAVKGAPMVFDSQTGQFISNGASQQAAANGTSNGKSVEPNDGDTFKDPNGKIVYWSKEKQKYMPVG